MADERPGAGAFAGSLLMAAALAVVGLALLGLSWHGAARETELAFQLPYVVSGALGGLSMVVLGLAVARVQVSRWIEERRRAELSRLLRATEELSQLVADRLGGEAGS